MVISFYRGEWCPFCNIELHGLQEALPKIQELGATLIAISPEKPDFGILATEKNKLTFPVLSDSGNTVARQFGIVFQVGEELREFSKNVFKNDIALRNGDESYGLPVPATLVLDTTGIIRFAHVDVDYMTGRVEPETVVAALQTIAHPVPSSSSLLHLVLGGILSGLQKAKSGQFEADWYCSSLTYSIQSTT